MEIGKIFTRYKNYGTETMERFSFFNYLVNYQVQ